MSLYSYKWVGGSGGKKKICLKWDILPILGGFAEIFAYTGVILYFSPTQSLGKIRISRENIQPWTELNWTDGIAEKSPVSDLDSNAQFLYQNITVDPNTKYSFSVRAINVQGGSKFSQEKIKELKG